MIKRAHLFGEQQYTICLGIDSWCRFEEARIDVSLQQSCAISFSPFHVENVTCESAAVAFDHVNTSTVIPYYLINMCTVYDDRTPFHILFHYKIITYPAVFFQVISWSPTYSVKNYQCILIVRSIATVKA